MHHNISQLVTAAIAAVAATYGWTPPALETLTARVAVVEHVRATHGETAASAAEQWLTTRATLPGFTANGLFTITRYRGVVVDLQTYTVSDCV